MTSGDRRAALLLGVASAGVFAVVFYALLRGVGVLLAPGASPATIIWSRHEGYFWRLWAVAYASGMAGLLGRWAALRDPVRTARALALAVPWAIGALVVQSLFLP